jgi:tetratricopeptide (TPR) repeat protein
MVDSHTQRIGVARALALHPPHDPGYARMLSIVARETMFRTDDRGPLDRSAEDLAREAIDAAERSGDDSALAAALVTLGSVLMGRGLLDEGRPHLERSIGLSRRIGDPMMEARGVNNLSHYLREQGRHAQALELLEAFLAAPGRTGSAWVHGGFTSQNLAEIHYELGDLGTARTIAARALGHSPSPMHRVFLLVPAARAAIAQGDLAAARSGADRAGLHEAGIASLDRASVLSLERLDALLAESDIVSLHAPDVPSTRGMLGAREFALMRDGATFMAEGGPQAASDARDAVLVQHQLGQGSAKLRIGRHE